MTDADFAAFANLTLDEVARMDPAYRARLERLAPVVNQVLLYDAGLGPKPAGVIVCRAGRGKR